MFGQVTYDMYKTKQYGINGTHINVIKITNHFTFKQLLIRGKVISYISNNTAICSGSSTSNSSNHNSIIMF